ncbi:MAG TPA: chloride channel protein [Candidatus Aminicenantes bacterium]|nr:chloride channel protein [Candidatus Aminicenantes bacterium]HRY65542.1 chloride channel protein [Candidatus Aminicenantes bacterium]HRZ72570.1 chloride channel protein [Candidatus Aminicenantes bacterium]
MTSDEGTGRAGRLAAAWTKRLPADIRENARTVILSLAAGFSAVAFLVLTNLLFNKTYVVFASRSRLFFVAASFLLIMAVSLAAGLLLRTVPEAAGSGIPQAKAAFWKDLGWIPARPVVVKFVAGILSIGGGQSLGREGPSVFLGAGVSSNLAGAMRPPRRDRRGAAIIGASAGLAAAFNTPLAAITFAVEEVIGDLNSRFLGRVALASVIGALAVQAVLGRQPSFSLPSVESASWLHYLIVPVVALLAALIGRAFQASTLRLLGRVTRQSRLPRWLLPVFGGFATWVIGVSVFLATGKLGVFGLGYRDLSSALANSFDWRIAGLLVAAKFVATVASYGCGGCGGIFAPSLFFGGMAGCFVGGLAGLFLPLTPADRIVLAAVGMSACLGAIVRAPLTSMLIVFEMTHQFVLVPGLLLGAVVSQAVARRGGPLNFYDALLVMNGHELHKIRPPLDLQSWKNLPVSAIANLRPVFADDLSPEGLRQLVDRHPYAHFPVVRNGVLAGLVARKEILAAAASGAAPAIGPAVKCYPDQTVREIGDKFIGSPSNILVVVDRSNGTVVGIITLHDLLRAQAAVEC